MILCRRFPVSSAYTLRPSSVQAASVSHGSPGLLSLAEPQVSIYRRTLGGGEGERPAATSALLLTCASGGREGRKARLLSLGSHGFYVRSGPGFPVLFCKWNEAELL